MHSKIFEAERTDEGDYVFRVHRPHIFDDETRAHLLEARRDVLLAVRNVIDAVLSATEDRDPERPGRRQNIDIE